MGLADPVEGWTERVVKAMVGLLPSKPALLGLEAFGSEIKAAFRSHKVVCRYLGECEQQEQEDQREQQKTN